MPPVAAAPRELPFLESLSWNDRGWRELSPLEMLHRYETGWRWRGVLADPTEEERAPSLRRPRHQAVATVLAQMDPGLLRGCRCWFGGGTRIVLDLDEYRVSADLGFLRYRATNLV